MEYIVNDTTHYKGLLKVLKKATARCIQFMGMDEDLYSKATMVLHENGEDEVVHTVIDILMAHGTKIRYVETHYYCSLIHQDVIFKEENSFDGEKIDKWWTSTNGIDAEYVDKEWMDTNGINSERVDKWWP